MYTMVTLVNNTILHIISLYMVITEIRLHVMNDQFIVYTNIKSLRCAPETEIVYVSYISIKKC